ncbi:MAG: rhodanese-like domain-containing protein [Bacteroidota bacterium]
MKKLSLFFIGFLLVPALFLTSCDRGEDPGTGVTTPAFDLMTDYMIANDMDVDKIKVNTDGEKFVVGAPALADVDAFIAKYYIMDIRNATDFGTSHISGAKNVAFGDILTEAANAGGKPILVVCYTGQTACYATSLLRLYGYNHTRALKWGMSGWSPTTSASWDNKTGDIANGHANWSYSAAPSNNVYDNPSFTSLSQDGGEILKARVEEVVAAGFKTASGADVLNSPGNYFINNYFSDADYSGFGHIKDAYRIIDHLKLVDDGQKNLDPGSSAKVITYCYTGQTSAVVTAWLQVLGYDAYSLTFGMNGLYHSNNQWASNQWGVDSHPKDLPLVH